MIPAFQRLVLCLAAAALFGGCVVVPRSPTIDIVGSYFPAWVVCAVLGVIFSILVRLVLIGLRLDDYVGPKAIFYPAVTVTFALSIWLVFYSN